DLLVFPMRGVFVKQHAARSAVVADACHALLFAANQPYRVSHPVAGGDECLVLEPSPEALFELYAAECDCVPLDASLIAARRLLWSRLQRRLASTLETDETALELLARVMRTPAPPAPRRRARAGGRDMVEATRVTLAAYPGEAWSLATLAQRV